jgi:cytochrome c oxidase subunit 2
MLKFILLLSLLALTACNGGISHHAQQSNAGIIDFSSNGERIYFTGVSQSGNPISARGGGSMTGMHQQMSGGGCASCHGADREGQRLWPQFWIKAPALTSKALFGGDEHSDSDDGHGDHADYDARSLALAITKGIDPGGNSLNPTMPRWSLSSADLSDLISFLGQDHDHD